MDKLVIEGGIPLQGEVTIDGAKNAALPSLAAALLPERGETLLRNMPPVRDIQTMCGVLHHMGADLERQDGSIRVGSKPLSCMEAPYDLVRTMRASVMVLGPLVARYGYAKVSFPGGCAIGARPINLHLAGLEAMGATIHLDGGYIEARAPRLRGAEICLDIPTVTGTMNLMMAASLADGTTHIDNAAKEPEIVNIAEILTAMGARIQGAGTERIEIEGVRSLSGASHTIIPDRIETGTFAAAAAITGGDVRIRGAALEHLSSVIQKLRATGMACDEDARGLHVRANARLASVDVKTSPHPGFPTDMQAQFMSLMSLAEGTSLIRETVFENRFMHVAELRRMGANIRVEGSSAIVRGVPILSGAPVMATDLRASASLVLAGLAAEGTTTIARIYHLDRGYSRLESKLLKLGARVHRVKE